MQKIIDAEKSDLFDVLAYVAYALPPLNRKERAERAKVAINGNFSEKQRAFLDFVLAHYVSVGVEELTTLLRLKYHYSIADALADLGRPEDIGQVFAGFQKYLYQDQVGGWIHSPQDDGKPFASRLTPAQGGCKIPDSPWRSSRYRCENLDDSSAARP